MDAAEKVARHRSSVLELAAAFVFCGGKVERKTVTFSYEEDDKFFLVENVSAEVCTRCGEKTYSPEVAEELVRFARGEFKPKKTVTVPVFDFAERF